MSAKPTAPWRAILFTDQAFTVAAWAQLLGAVGHQLVAVVTSKRRNPEYLSVVGAAGSLDVDVLVSDRRRAWAAMLAPLRPDLIVSTSFPWRLPADLLALPTHGAINLHPSPLPRYRGTDTLRWQLRHGEREGGVTMHRMSGEFDTGAILAQAPVTIDDDDDEVSLLGKIVTATPPIVIAGLTRLARGEAGEAQDESQASYHGKIPDEAAWKTIDWSAPAREVHNVVRSSRYVGALPPGAVGTLDGVPQRITRTRLLPDGQGGGMPGTIVAREGSTLTVQCGDGVIAVIGAEPV